MAHLMYNKRTFEYVKSYNIDGVVFTTNEAEAAKLLNYQVMDLYGILANLGYSIKPFAICSAE